MSACRWSLLCTRRCSSMMLPQQLPAIWEKSSSGLSSPGLGVLQLLLVVPSRGLFEDAATDGRLARNAEDYLKRTAEHLTQEHAGLAVTWSVAVESDAAAGIIRVAEHGKTTEEPGGYTRRDVIVVASPRPAGPAPGAPRPAPQRG